MLVAACSLAVTAERAVIEVAAAPGLTNGSLQQRLCSSEGAGLEDSTTLLLGPGVHSLVGASCIVADVRDLEIVGRDAASIVCAEELVGSNFIFLNVTNLTIQGISVENCGRVLPADLPPYVNNTLFFLDTDQKGVFIFAHVTNLLLLNFKITRSFGFGVIGINLKGDAELRNVSVTDTDNYRHPLCHGNETDLSCSGSGLEFLYSDPTSEDVDFFPAHTTLTVVNCSILGNQNLVPVNRFVPVFLSIRGSFMMQRLVVTGATGLGIYLGQRAYNVDVNIVSSNISHNVGYSSGVAFLLFNTIRNVHIEMKDCVLRGNEGFQLARGGAIVMLVITYVSELGSFPKYPPGIHDLLRVHDTTFTENFADIGGAAYFFFAPQNISDYSVTFDNVTFEANRATVGTVFEADTRPATFLQSGVHFLMVDVTARDNALPTSLLGAFATASENSAAFAFLSIMNVTIIGRNETGGSNFVRNSPGPFLVVGGHLYLRGKISFVNNTSLRGGALSLYDYSLLFVFEGARINFVHNSAVQVGGAIYASSPGTGTAPTCVVQVIGPHRIFDVKELDQLDLSLNFVGNTANNGGNSVYLNPLYGCASLPESSLVDIAVIFDSSVFYGSLFEFDMPTSNQLSEICSTPEHICFCSSGAPLNNSAEICAQRSAEMTVVPGQSFTLQLSPFDLSYNPVSSILIIDLNSTSHHLGQGQTSSQLNGGKCTTVDLDMYGPEHSEVALVLHTQQGTSVLWVVVALQACPPAFHLETDSHGVSQCVCDSHVATIGSECNFSSYTVTRRQDSWLGTEERDDGNDNRSDVVYVALCPIGFCNNDYAFVDLTVPDQLCERGRTGVLCGACKSNLSVVFGSPECLRCSNYWIFTAFVYAVAGVLLVAILFLLNVNISQGSFSSISVIFYVNVVSVNADIMFQSNNRGFLFIWVSLLNLELGFPLCFYDGMNEAAKAGLQCIFPVYLLCITLAVIFLSYRSRHIARLTASRGIQVVATLLYLSFSKMLRYVIDILSFATLRGEEQNRVIWRFDGNLDFATGTHILIMIMPALLTLFFIVLYTSSLVFIKQIESCTSKIKPLMDAYGGLFKDKYRFWFGLRLVVLAAMCLTDALIGTDDPALSAIVQQIFLILLMLLQAFLRPFTNQLLNAIDLLYMLDLFFLLLYTVRVVEVSLGQQKIVVNALVGIAFTLFVLGAAYHVYSIPRVRKKLSPYTDKLKQLSWSDVKAFLCGRCRKPVAKAPPLTLTSMISVDGKTTQSENFSSTMVSLEGSVDADKALQRVATFSRWRDPIVDSF